VSMKELEGFRQKAFAYSSTDRLGNVMSRTFELMLNVVKDGMKGENLPYAVQSLEMERKLALQEDSKDNLPLRELMFGLCECFEQTIGTLIEKGKSTSDEQRDSQENVTPQEDQTSLENNQAIKEVKQEEPDLPDDEAVDTGNKSTTKRRSKKSLAESKQVQPSSATAVAPVAAPAIMATREPKKEVEDDLQIVDCVENQSTSSTTRPPKQKRQLTLQSFFAKKPKTEPIEE
ncbi:hypothetical protein PFISCL1PPCAC_27560, partial [Pristionchus fissidentatus]